MNFHSEQFSQAPKHTCSSKRPCPLVGLSIHRSNICSAINPRGFSLKLINHTTQVYIYKSSPIWVGDRQYVNDGLVKKFLNCLLSTCKQTINQVDCSCRRDPLSGVDASVNPNHGAFLGGRKEREREREREREGLFVSLAN